jgi:hypothetical protein
MNQMVQAYIECALWAEDLNADLAPETLAAMSAECGVFVQRVGQQEREALLALPTQAGHDLWLTRNGHGTGFWDRPEIWGEEGSKSLTLAAKAMGERELYIGDDGLIYMGGHGMLSVKVPSGVILHFAPGEVQASTNEPGFMEWAGADLSDPRCRVLDNEEGVFWEASYTLYFPAEWAEYGGR